MTDIIRFFLIILSLLSFQSKAHDVFDTAISTTNTGDDVFATVDEKFTNANKAKLIVMNKITANSKELLLNIGSKITYGRAEIEVIKCVKTNDKKDNNLLLVSLKENEFDKKSKQIFRGWLFSNSNSLSAVEHPVYQLIAISCS